MSGKRITEMNGQEFEDTVEAYIERESQNMGEIDAPLFYDAIEEIFAAETETVEVEGQISGSTLQLQPVTETGPGVHVHDNEIVVNNIRFVIRLAAEAGS